MELSVMKEVADIEETWLYRPYILHGGVVGSIAELVRHVIVSGKPTVLLTFFFEVEKVLEIVSCNIQKFFLSSCTKNV